MKFLEVYSSVVIVGEGFSPSIFSASKYQNILGKPDIENQVIIPILLQQIFPESKYKVIITPDRLDFGYSGIDYLPKGLKELSIKMINKLKEFENYNFNGIGLNVNVVIADNILGMSGTKFCKSKFLNIEKIEDKLDIKNSLTNTAKLIFFKDTIKYMVEIEPNFRSKGKHLQVKLNAHQNCSTIDQLLKSFSKFDSIKSYSNKFHDNLLDKDNE